MHQRRANRDHPHVAPLEARVPASRLAERVEHDGGALAVGGEDEPAENLTIHADESLNAIVVRADPSRMAEILDIVAALDVRRKQVLIEAAVVEVRIEDGVALGVELERRLGVQSSSATPEQQEGVLIRSFRCTPRS